MIPRLLIAFFILMTIADAWVSWSPLNDAFDDLSYWFSIVAAFALIPNITSMLVLNFRRAGRYSRGLTNIVWRAVITLVTFVFVLYLGFSQPGGATGANYSLFYYYVVAVTSQSLSGIFLNAYAIEYAYKVMKIVSLEAAAFIIPGIIFFLGKIPIFTGVVPQLGPMSDWIVGKLITGGTVGALIAGTLTEIVFGIKSMVLQEENVVVEV
jgi:hypothetical protein